MQTFLAPVRAFFDLSLYRKAASAGISFTAKYLLVFALWGSTLLLAGYMIMASSMVTSTLEWVKTDFPPLRAASGGLTLLNGTNYQMTHPRWGDVVLFDMAAQGSGSVNWGDNVALVTSTDIYVKSGGQISRYPVNVMGERPYSDATDVRKTVVKLASIMIAGAPPVTFISSFILLFAAPLVLGFPAALIGMALNMLSKRKRSFPEVYCISVTALTPAIVIFTVAAMMPRMGSLPWKAWILAGASLVYVFVGLQSDGGQVPQKKKA